MSEIISYEPASVLAPENLSGASVDAGAEINNDNWDVPLFSLVAANADVLVKCPWMGGTETTLSSAMNAYSEPITEQNVHAVINVVHELLANRVIETEETAEEEPEEEEPTQPDEKKPAKAKEADQKINAQAEAPKKPPESNQENNIKTHVQKAPAKPSPVITGKQPKKEIEVAKHSESLTKPEDPTDSKKINVPAPATAVPANPARGELRPSALEPAKAEALSPSTSAAATAAGSEAPPAASHTSEYSMPKSGINKTDQAPAARSVKNQLNAAKPVVKPEVKVIQPIAAFEAPPQTKPAGEEILIVNTPPPAVGQEPELESSDLNPAIETAGEPEPLELTDLDFGITAITDEITEPGNEEIYVSEDDEPTLVNIDYQMGMTDPIDFAEGEVLLDHFEEINLEAGELYELSDIPTLAVIEDNLEAEPKSSIYYPDDESNYSKPIEISPPEQPPQISLTVKEIENSLIQLSERLETVEPKIVEEVNELLDKIIAVPAKIEDLNEETIITEAEAQAELEELFTELLDRLDIGYTLELVESLARLTLQSSLADEIENLKMYEETETDKPFQPGGTHEIIQKLLVSLNNIKRAMAHACAIGKSALQLYNFDFAT